MISADSKFRSGTASYSVRTAVAVALGTAALMAFAPHASAANAPAAKDSGDQLEEVQVTGSRIVRKDLVSNSPLVTVDSTTLENRQGLNIESYLNQLPEFNPAASPVTTQQDVQITAVNSVGIASVSLRGFGPNRSLVLVDNRRATPSNALMVVDVNTIPSSMIKRVEIISGGASAVYGADAIGGVSNFILRRDFTGMEADLQYGVSEAGDGAELRASALVGSKVADNRGNIVFAAEYYDRKAAYQRNRDFYQKGYADPTVGGNFIGFIMGVNGYNAASTPFSPVTLGAILGKTPDRVVGGGQSINLGFFGGRFSAIFAGVRFNPDGSIFDPAGNNASTFHIPLDGSNYALQTTFDSSRTNSGALGAPPPTVQTVKYNDTELYAASPQTRYSFMGSADYDITDHVKFFTSARFAQSTTKTFLSGTNASFGWEATVPYNATTDSPLLPTLDFTNAAVVTAALADPNNPLYKNPNFIAHGAPGAQHPVPAALAALLNSRSVLAVPPFPAINPLTTGWIAETYPSHGFDKRATLDVANAWQVEAGVKFDIPVKDWTGEVYYSRGESSTYNQAFGNNSLARWRAEVTSPDYGANSNLQSNLTNNGPGASPGFGSVAVHCTSGFYDTLFKGDAKASADCLYAVNAALQTHTANQQDIGELNFQGGLFNLPAGEVRGAAGYQYRRNASQFTPDILQSTASFTDQVIGVYPTGYLDQETSVKDVYGELLVPVVAGLPFLKKLELDLGGRYSSYDKTASTTTFKVNYSAEINDYVRLRGGFNRATRAPNLGELFLNLQQIFTIGNTYGDPCSTLSNSPFGAGGAQANYFGALQPGGPGTAVTLSPTTAQGTLASGQTAAGAASALLICKAQMGAAAAAALYGNATTPAAFAQGAATGGTFNWVNQKGNANLKSETSDTWTAGFVLQSPFESAWLSGLTATADWYQIKISDAIEPYSIDYSRFLCYGAITVTDPTAALAQANSTACLNLPRNQANGGAVSTLLQYANQATVSTSGIDFGVNWHAKLSDLGLSSVPGALGISVAGTWLDSYKTKTSPAPFDPTVEWKGSLGPNMAGFNGGAYAYRVSTALNYTLADWSVSLRWRHLPAVSSAARALQDAIKANNAAVVAGATGLIKLSYTPLTDWMAPAYDGFDLSANWNVNETISVRAGVNNLFDTAPVITGKTSGYASGDLTKVCNGAPGCQNPTSYSLGTSGQGTTSPGYYDVLGRSYFIALKAKF
jgi:outer membrane receptor protein involved in Fe transport